MTTGVSLWVGETIVDNWRAGMDGLQVATRDGGAPSTKTSVTLLY
ncbi:MAG: hypothetical protein WAM60_18710 [Candidatus Promineifilaceae bacterium]